MRRTMSETVARVDQEMRTTAHPPATAQKHHDVVAPVLVEAARATETGTEAKENGTIHIVALQAAARISMVTRESPGPDQQLWTTNVLIAIAGDTLRKTMDNFTTALRGGREEAPPRGRGRHLRAHAVT